MPRPAEPPTPARRRAGRPRARGRLAEGDPTEEILTAAGRLFGQLGVAGTTMAALAEAVGLGQSSLYYYFRSRDEVVAELVARANVVPLELIERIAASGGSRGAQLHRFVQGDTEALCELPFDIGEIHRIAARDRERFADYWSERRRLERTLARLVRAGIDDGQFRAVDPRLSSLTIMANDEGVQNWYRVGSRRRPGEIGRHLADLTVAGLLAEGHHLVDVHRELGEDPDG